MAMPARLPGFVLKDQPNPPLNINVRLRGCAHRSREAVSFISSWLSFSQNDR